MGNPYVDALCRSSLGVVILRMFLEVPGEAFFREGFGELFEKLYGEGFEKFFEKFF